MTMTGDTKERALSPTTTTMTIPMLGVAMVEILHFGFW
jgi:hypothetical protein